MTKSNFPISSCFLLLWFLVLYVTRIAADPLFTICSVGSNYTSNSTFDLNLKQFLQSLPSKTSSTGYYNTTIGHMPDQVHGLGLCRGDITSLDCQNCIQNAAQGIIKLCPHGKEATIFYEVCEVRYSYMNFFSLMVYIGKYPKWNESAQDISDPITFTEALRGLLTKVSRKATSDAKSLFSTGQVGISGKNKIYSLAQCTKDITPGSCQECLTNTIGDIVGCCSQYKAGIVLSPSCSLRFELFQFYRVLSDAKDKRARTSKIAIGISVSMALSLLLIGTVFYCRSQRTPHRKDEEKSGRALLHDLVSPRSINFSSKSGGERDEMNNQELPLFDLLTIKLATEDFSDSRILGQGGFGIVYKGVMPDGKEVAVKRLSRRSWQGLEEFKNEVILIAKLQHRNLVRLLGCAIEEEEKLLIYEFMPNRSLDWFLFDPARSKELDWKTRLNIINGIARGLLYLHEDSRLMIIHRDLKPNNVLLDDDMNAKISDFGMARIFGENQKQANTRRVVGTHGYMAPEYAMEGLFSIKSDVFSFGVVCLEILSGKRSNGFYLTGQAQSLLSYAWKLWSEGRGLEFIDPLLMESSSSEQELLRCFHVGLLCVQKDAADRPTMSFVAVALGSELLELPPPTQPAFSVGRSAIQSGTSISVNVVTISDVTPR